MFRSEEYMVSTLKQMMEFLISQIKDDWVDLNEILSRICIME